MRVVTIILIVVALAVAGATAFLVSQFLASTEEAAQAPVEVVEEPKVEVLVTTTDLPIGKILQREDFTWTLWPEDSVLPDYIFRQAGGEDGDTEIISDIAGAAVRVEMIGGEPIMSNKIFKRGDSGFLSGVLSPGMRAITVGVDPETGGGGFVLPGDRVDLIVIFDVPDEDEVTGETTNLVVSETILQDIRILAVGQEVAIEGGGGDETLTEVAETVTLEVTPNQAQVVSVADQMGRLRLVLRSSIEGELSEVPIRYSPDYVVSQFLARRVPETARVLVARRDLPEHTVLTDRDWVWLDFPATEIESDWLREGTMDVNSLRSALTETAVAAGEPFVVERMILPGQDGYITTILDPGMRAITIFLDESSAVSAFISPGDRVDVLYQLEVEDETDEPIKDPRRFSETLLENIRVLHLDREFEGEDNLPEMSSGQATATLEVRPHEAEMLSVAITDGSLSLVLRGDDPGDDTRTTGYTMDFDASRGLTELLYGLAIPEPPDSLQDLYAAEPEEPEFDDTTLSTDPDAAELLDLQDYLSDLGGSANGGSSGSSGSGGDSASGRSEGELRVYRSTLPQDLTFESQ
tara:strand:- start:22117 stop:23856 length:1740 start_codon:yes stop_codon:yes gene_type:complete